MFQKIKITSGRSFVVGDIHGQFSLLEAELKKLNFDKETDSLFSVGDLVDRGPESNLAVHYLQQPWFNAIRGNHEQMVIDAAGTSWHVGNGGAWWHDLVGHEKDMFIYYFSMLPYIMEVELPSGKRIGLCHASYPPSGTENGYRCDWRNAENWANRPSWAVDENEILWDRYQINRAKKAVATGEKGLPFLEEFNIKNIDHVYFGHTPLKEALHVGNCSWIDTGAFATNMLTIIEL